MPGQVPGPGQDVQSLAGYPLAAALGVRAVPPLLQANGVLVDALQGSPEPAAGGYRHPVELRLAVRLGPAARLPGTAGQLVGDRSRLKPVVEHDQHVQRETVPGRMRRRIGSEDLVRIKADTARRGQD